MRRKYLRSDIISILVTLVKAFPRPAIHREMVHCKWRVPMKCRDARIYLTRWHGIFSFSDVSSLTYTFMLPLFQITAKAALTAMKISAWWPRREDNFLAMAWMGGSQWRSIAGMRQPNTVYSRNNQAKLPPSYSLIIGVTILPMGIDGGFSDVWNVPVIHWSRYSSSICNRRV